MIIWWGLFVCPENDGKEQQSFELCFMIFIECFKLSCYCIFMMACWCGIQFGFVWFLRGGGRRKDTVKSPERENSSDQLYKIQRNTRRRHSD